MIRMSKSKRCKSVSNKKQKKFAEDGGEVYAKAQNPLVYFD
jgi:hypothetical protein